MTEQEEAAYMQGQRAAYAAVMANALRCLGYTGQATEGLFLEREAAVARLRSLCAEFGDNDWKSDLHLADIIDKHLGRYLWERDGSLGALTKEEFEAVQRMRET